MTTQKPKTEKKDKKATREIHVPLYLARKAIVDHLIGIYIADTENKAFDALVELSVDGTRKSFKLREMIQRLLPKPRRPYAPSRQEMLDALVSGDEKKIAELQKKAKAFAEWKEASTPKSKIS